MQIRKFAIVNAGSIRPPVKCDGVDREETSRSILVNVPRWRWKLAEVHLASDRPGAGSETVRAAISAMFPIKKAKLIEHDLGKRGILLTLLHDFLTAYRERTEAWQGSPDDAILVAINNLSRKVDQFMATQEERLQAISAKIDEVLADLAALKSNNPQIEDEISAIEAKLSIAQPTTTGVITGDNPAPEGGA